MLTLRYMARILYKYTSAKFIDSILSDGGMLKLSNPSSFNDPNDCYFGISDEKEDIDASERSKKALNTQELLLLSNYCSQRISA